MKDGFVKIAVGRPDIRVADCSYNAAQIIALIDRAAKEGVGVLAFPELCITGYTCGDLFLQDALIRAAEAALLEIVHTSSASSMLILLGLPLEHNGKLYNCCAAVCNGKLLGVVPKSHLPNYAEFYEVRHFSPAPAEMSTLLLDGQTVPFGTHQLFHCTTLPKLTVGVEICEDLWNLTPPSLSLCKNGATLIVNLSASPEAIGKMDYRRSLVSSVSAQAICAYAYACIGNGESTADVVFAGHSLIAENGIVLAESAPFSETQLLCTEIDVARLAFERRRMTTYPAATSEYTTTPFSLSVTDLTLTRMVDPHPFVPSGMADRDARCELILAIQSQGLRKRLEHTGSRTAVLGISGGLDSTLALLVTVRAFDLLKRPRTDIIAVTMPCFGTTSRTKSNAVRLCEELGVTLREINITKAVRQHFTDISHEESNTNVVYENAQARERTQILMDLANGSGGLVIGTGDLSELALGWATYNGDHMSMYAVNCSVPKTLVRHIVGYYAAASGGTLQAVLEDILATPVSPELLPARDGEISQRTEDLVGPFELHDFFLYHLVRCGDEPAKILRLADRAFSGTFDHATILRWLKIFIRRFFAQQFKRSCLPDGPKVGSVALSPRGDWRMPSDASAAVWLSQLDNLS